MVVLLLSLLATRSMGSEALRASGSMPRVELRRHSAAVVGDVVVDPDASLKTGIAGFYDGLSGLWESVWGEHLHHGYYDLERSKKLTLKDHQAAQVRMMDEILFWGLPQGDQTATKILDVGCGIGGASRHLARRFKDSKVTGITLSPKQVVRATALSSSLACDFKVQDALDLPETWRDQHSIVWSLESGEHMPNKPKFVENLVKATKPGGRVLLVTWCHRDLKEKEKDLKRSERFLLGVINKCYYLPKWCSVADYEKLFKEQGMVDLKRADWTKNIAPFWPAVIGTAIKPKNFFRLLGTGIDGLRSAIAMCLMVLGYRTGLIRFGLITCRKPDDDVVKAQQQQTDVASSSSQLL